MSQSRREFLGMAAGTVLAGLVAGESSIAATPSSKTPVLIFTKHLQFIPDLDQMAKTAAEIGFDGLDLAVRPGGHILPDKVETDLPRAAEAAKKAGFSIGMITTAIQDAAKPESRTILTTAAKLGIKTYRIGGWEYDSKEPIPDQMKKISGQLAALAKLNRELGVCAAYQNHSGEKQVGAPLWDLWEMMREIDPAAMGVNFDIGHATVEGGSVWPTDFRLVAPRTKVVTIKDFHWEKSAKGKWAPAWGPLGEGMIEGPRFLKMVKESNFAGPITLHFEYEPKDASGKQSHEALLAAMKKDLLKLRGWLTQAGLG